ASRKRARERVMRRLATLSSIAMRTASPSVSALRSCRSSLTLRGSTRRAFFVREPFAALGIYAFLTSATMFAYCGSRSQYGTSFVSNTNLCVTCFITDDSLLCHAERSEVEGCTSYGYYLSHPRFGFGVSRLRSARTGFPLLFIQFNPARPEPFASVCP